MPRTRTRWPGQTGSTCWYCGSDMVWDANGITKALTCSASRQWHCWNSISFDGPLAAERIGVALESHLSSLGTLDVQFRQMVADGMSAAPTAWKLAGGNSSMTPAREAIRVQSAEWFAGGASLATIASRLDVKDSTVRLALADHQEMLESGCSDPYVRVDAPPADLVKFKRHRNPRYVFRPREGYSAPPLIAG